MVYGSRLILWCNYRQSGNGAPTTIAVPSPDDADTPDVPYWYDWISMHANHFAKMGVTDILGPCPLEPSGLGPGDDGYNPENDYGINVTRFGNREKFLRCVAICHANGMNYLIDHVMHQRMGGSNGTYVYEGSKRGVPGRFGKTPDCFRWNGSYGVPEDPVIVPQDDFPFGDELCPVNAKPAGYVWNGLLDAAEWIFAQSGADGARLDDMKGMALSFEQAFLNAPWAQGKFFFGEYDDGNVQNLAWWVGAVEQKCSAEDFGFQENQAYPMCMRAGAGDWDMRWMGGALCDINPMKAVTFVSSMDSETNGWQTIIENKTLAFALMCGKEGLPMFYIKDWLAEPQGYGLAPPMENLAWCVRCLMNGPTVVLYADQKVMVFQRTGYPGTIVALCNDIWNPDWTTVTCYPKLPVGTVLKDYSGKNAQDCQVQPGGSLTFGIPPAANGQGYGVWSLPGMEQEIGLTPRHTVQTMYGADDLKDCPALNGSPVTLPRIWCGEGTALDGVPAGAIVTPPAGSPDLTTLEKLPATGWYTIMLTHGSGAFKCKLTYTASQTLSEEQLA